MTSIATIAGALPLMLATGAGAGSRTSIGVVGVRRGLVDAAVAVRGAGVLLVVAPRTRPPDERTQRTDAAKQRVPRFDASRMPESVESYRDDAAWWPPAQCTRRLHTQQRTGRAPAMPAAANPFRRRLETGANRRHRPCAKLRCNALRLQLAPARGDRRDAGTRAKAHPRIHLPSRPARCSSPCAGVSRACPVANSAVPWRRLKLSAWLWRQRADLGAARRRDQAAFRRRLAGRDPVPWTYSNTFRISAPRWANSRVLKPGGALLLTVPWHWTNAGSRGSPHLRADGGPTSQQ